jgi:hypothetical protein
MRDRRVVRVMRNGTLLGVLAGLALTVCATGASRTFVALPPPVIACFGIVMLVLARKPIRLTPLLVGALAIGAALGLALPRSLPIGRVATHSPGGVHDGNLFALLDRLDDDPRAVLGENVSVSGVWTPPSHGHAATVSRRVMACCAADAIDVGFDVHGARGPLSAGQPVVVRGFVHAVLADGELRYSLDDAHVDAIDTTPIREGNSTSRERPQHG